MPFLQTVVARVVGFSQSKFHRFYDPNISLHVLHFGILEPYSLFLLVGSVHMFGFQIDPRSLELEL